jgi:hypothetical protein
MALLITFGLLSLVGKWPVPLVGVGMLGLAVWHTADILERNAPNWERQRIEHERERVGVTAAVFVADALEGVTAVRWREMRERWRARSGKPRDLQHAVISGPFRFTREADGWLYVYPREAPEPEHTEPAPMVELHPAPASVRGLPEKVDGVYVHKAECSSWMCDSPASLAPRYARRRPHLAHRRVPGGRGSGG